MFIKTVTVSEKEGERERERERDRERERLNLGQGKGKDGGTSVCFSMCIHNIMYVHVMSCTPNVIHAASRAPPPSSDPCSSLPGDCNQTSHVQWTNSANH